ncbi:hypothetical protein FGSG_12702 [Fusarium graminearum PH-1]|uniref:Chromosome 3, complete genome n=1 Tax=Gibberella zeae (strain ATCC MYA-4620 / CBS 123657 / FGSC 9075 / NRRL 31084 / PH-1) TaxID=229533 RepID=I1S779_GIBZE|nr:hypothetical protein FGSG_12702 [Fusarium graminearum PH-1]ESU11143.1 hypothetical protein FGSG_12702 [Fusarium graminearum PH-1]CEF87407.1 unnamed protein product [Fusarium graminearum]|eukprot:XP_011323719.1 hypothetical protein FGSG_12702 [Fusarium graminearum PH-1]
MLQAEFGARSSGPEQIHDTAIVTGINSVGPRLRSKERRKVAFWPCSQQSTHRIHARITPMSHTYDGSRLSSRFANDWLFMTNLSVYIKKQPTFKKAKAELLIPNPMDVTSLNNVQN